MAKTTRKRKKKYNIKLPTLLEKADKVFSFWIRTRDNFTCVVCGSKERPQCGHLIKRGKHNTRFDEKNCNCQCSSCNWFHNEYPEAYTMFFLDKYGIEEYRKLMKSAYATPKKHQYTREELNEIIKKYSKE